MEENLLSYICDHANYAPYVLCGLLFLAGLNIPISEDLLLLTAGALVSRCLPDNYLSIYLWMYAGCCLSGWETYWIGRLLGTKLYEIKWFKTIINPERIRKLHTYYEKYGIWTFIVGRFFPGGVRNALYITSGMGKMPFPLFILRDGVAAIFSTNLMFYLGYVFAKNYEWIAAKVVHYDRIAALIFITLILLALAIRWKFFRT
jgi:membrane-associated protein